MPKRKHRPPAPVGSLERKARGERLVHREEMHASVGDVLETEHIEQAIRLLYREDEIAGHAGAVSPSGGVVVAPDAAPVVDEPARAPAPPPRGTTRPARRGRLSRFVALWRASLAALGALSVGTQEVRRDVMAATRNATAAFRDRIHERE